MLKRYSGRAMSDIWSEKNKFYNWLLVEIAVLEVRHQLGELAYKIPLNLSKKIQINPEEINRIENEITKHDVVAFLEYISPQFPEELRSWLHRGLTSYDILDTALSLQLRESVKIIIRSLTKLMDAIKKVALEHKYTQQIGRTHGIHAEPITFGVKLANWFDEFKRHLLRMHRLFEIISVGKISGAVGMYTIDPKIEELVCKKLDLTPIIATQIISRDIIAEYMSTLGILAASIGKISLNLRLLSQTEIGEIMEPFGKKQKGSSAMPHKKNPIGSENLSGLSRVGCANVQISYENLANCWHERSLDNSSAERVIIADSSILIDFELGRLTKIIENMQIFPKKMADNLNLTKGLIYSQDVMMLVAEKSKLPREEAHTLVREIALKCKDNDTNFLDSLLKDENIIKYMNEGEVRSCFSIEEKLRYVDYIFEKVFGE